MTQARTQPMTAPPDEPVRAALDDPGLLIELNRHALARLTVRLADRPRETRFQMVEDATQEAIKRALAKKDTYNRELATVAGWIHGILDRVLSEYCRTLRKQPSQLAADAAEWAGLAARFTNDDELNELLESLSEEDRRIISMRRLDCMSHQEIAAALGINASASRARLSRAMDVLRELIAKGGGR